jgi:urease accessory protein
LQPTDPALLQPLALAAYGGGWVARLHARVDRIASRSTLSSLRHHGPLRVQKALWPEGPDPVHLIVLHPPGGIAGGDALELALEIGARASALVTTPGAGHWYRADAPATQTVRLSVGEDATLEWLPQETIVHDGVQALATLELDVAAGGCAIGSEVTVLGRRESGERLDSGLLRQRLALRREGVLLLDEHACVDAAGSRSGVALGGHHVSGLLWAVARAPVSDALAGNVEAAMDASGVALAGATRADPHLVLARAVDSSPQRVRAALHAAWRALRPALTGREAATPRIWMT